MPNYRRAKTAGGTYFFTIVTYERQKIFLDTSTIQALKAAIQEVKQAYPFTIDAWVLLPDHMHCIWTLPQQDADYSKRMGLIKAKFTRQVKDHWQRSDWVTESKFKRHESTIWQRRFWEHQIRDERGFQRHFDYVHFNPVKHGCAHRVIDWPHSTFHRYVEKGVYPRDWAGIDDEGSGYGE